MGRRTPVSVVVAGLLGAACAPGPGGPPDLTPQHPCAQSGVARMDLAPPDGDYGDLAGDEQALWCGTPPQGGAPYTPLRLRLLGPEGFEDGVSLEMVAEDVETGEELAYTALTMGLTCANVGENEGFWVGSEAHMRYAGWGLEELDGRRAEVTVTATGIADPTAVAVARHEVEIVLERP